MPHPEPVNALRLKPVDGWLRRLSLRLLPPRCLLCSARAAGGQELCAACLADLPWNRSSCGRCALPLPTLELPAHSRLCGHCQRRAPAFVRLIAPLRYEFPLDSLITRFKFHHDLAAGLLLAELLADALAMTWPESDQNSTERPDLLVPVPLHDKRLRERGFNQALELAKRIAPRLGLPIDHTALGRRRATQAQSELAAKARRRNVHDAFIAEPTRVTDCHILLIDDVATTTATAEECARALKVAGARSVSVGVIARAPSPKR